MVRLPRSPLHRQATINRSMLPTAGGGRSSIIGPEPRPLAPLQTALISGGDDVPSVLNGSSNTAITLDTAAIHYIHWDAVNSTPVGIAAVISGGDDSTINIAEPGIYGIDVAATPTSFVGGPGPWQLRVVHGFTTPLTAMKDNTPGVDQTARASMIGWAPASLTFPITVRAYLFCSGGSGTNKAIFNAAACTIQIVKLRDL